MKTFRIALLAGVSMLAADASVAAPSYATDAEVIARAAHLSTHDVLVALGERHASYLWFVRRQDRVHAELRKALGEQRYEAMFDGSETPRPRGESLAGVETPRLDQPAATRGSR